MGQERNDKRKDFEYGGKKVDVNVTHNQKEVSDEDIKEALGGVFKGKIHFTIHDIICDEEGIHTKSQMDIMGESRILAGALGLALSKHPELVKVMQGAIAIAYSKNPDMVNSMEEAKIALEGLAAHESYQRAVHHYSKLNENEKGKTE